MPPLVLTADAIPGDSEWIDIDSIVPAASSGPQPLYLDANQPSDPDVFRFETWPEVVAAIEAMPAYVTAPLVYIIGNDAPLGVPFGSSVGQPSDTWQCRNVRLVGYDPTGGYTPSNSVNIQEDCKLQGLAEVNGLQLVVEAQDVITYTEGYSSSNIYGTECPVVVLVNSALRVYLPNTNLFNLDPPFSPGSVSLCLVCQNTEFGFSSNAEASANIAVIRTPATGLRIEGAKVLLNPYSFSAGNVLGSVAGLEVFGPIISSVSLVDPTAQDATEVPFTPATPGNWSPLPTQVKEALDELAAREDIRSPTYRTGRVPIEYLASPYQDYWLMPPDLDNVSVLVFIESGSVPTSAGTYTLTLERANLLPTIVNGVPATPTTLADIDLKAPDQTGEVLGIAAVDTSRYYKVVIEATNPDLQPAPIGGVPQGFIHYTVTFNYQ